LNAIPPLAYRNQLAKWQAVALSNYQLGAVRNDFLGDIGIN
jgi:hypothetical protein